MSMSQPKNLGPFRIIRVIGRGGMGAVYEAVHEQTNETVALKVLTAPEEEEELHVRFEAEIGTLKRLRHPNIVRLYGFGEENGLQYYAMEFVDGPSLQHFLKQKRLFTWEEVVHIGIEVSKALKHAHDRGIIHRDIKPANILLLPDGQVKVSDYGIAHFFGDSRLTTANMVIGTIEYMAPEQAQAGPLTPKSDLYSLGALLYALITGNPPYRARTLMEIHKCYQMGPPESIRYFRPEVPSTLDQFIMELLRIQPEKRPKNALIVTRRLQAICLAFSHNKNQNPFKGLSEENIAEKNQGISPSVSSSKSFTKGQNAMRSGTGSYRSLIDGEDAHSIFKQSETAPDFTKGSENLANNSFDLSQEKTPFISPVQSSSLSLSQTKLSDMNVSEVNDSTDFDFSDSVEMDLNDAKNDEKDLVSTDGNNDNMMTITHSTSLENNQSDCKSDYNIANTDYQNTFTHSTGMEDIDPEDINSPRNSLSEIEADQSDFHHTSVQSTGEQGLSNEKISQNENNNEKNNEFVTMLSDLPEDRHWSVDQIEAAFRVEGDSETAVTEAVGTLVAPQPFPQDDTRKDLETDSARTPSVPDKEEKSPKESPGSIKGWRATEFGLAQEKPNDASSSSPSGNSLAGGSKNIVIVEDVISQKTNDFDTSNVINTPPEKTVDFDLEQDLIKVERKKSEQYSVPKQGIIQGAPLPGKENTKDSEFSDQRSVTERKAIASRFVMVREEELDDSYRNKRDFPSVSPLVWGGGIILIMIGIFICYSLKRPSADTLYDKIERKINNDNKEFSASLRGAETEISNFLKYYPNDFRAGKVTDYYNEIQLGNLERRLEKQIEHGARNKNLSAIEIAYLEAIRTAGLDLEKGISKLRAFIQLFSVDGSLEMEDPQVFEEKTDDKILKNDKSPTKNNKPKTGKANSENKVENSLGESKEGQKKSKRAMTSISENSKNRQVNSSSSPAVVDDSSEKVKKQRQALQSRTTSGQCVLLANRRLESLLESFEKINVKQISLLENRLDHADSIEKSDPKHAREIRLSIIILYKDYHWAEPLVERARQADEKLKNANIEKPVPQKSKPAEVAPKK